MRLTLLRHGPAVDREKWSGDDADRPLTESGTELTTETIKAARDLIKEYIDAGLSKFVLYPAGPEPVERFVDRFLENAVPRQN